MSDNKPEFVDGLLIKAPSVKAPNFVKCLIAIKRQDLIAWLTEQKGDWINLDVKESKGGKWYAAVSNFKPKSGGKQMETRQENDDDFDDGIPF